MTSKTYGSVYITKIFYFILSLFCQFLFILGMLRDIWTRQNNKVAEGKPEYWDTAQVWAMTKNG